MFTIKVGNNDFTNFISANVNVSMDNFGRTFSLSCTQDNLKSFPILINQLVKISVDGVPIVTGYVEKIDPSVSDSTHTVSITGRSIAADLVDSSINGIVLNPPISLMQIIEKVMAFVGLDLKVSTNIKDLPNFTTSDMVAAEPAQGAFDFIEQYARKRQAILLDDGDGNIIVANASGVQSKYPLLLKQDGTDNNVLTSSTSYDYSQRYHRYIVISQANQSSDPLVDSRITAETDMRKREQLINQIAEEQGGASTEAVYQKGEAIDQNVRKSRVIVLEAENPSSPSECVKRAQWELNVRTARSRTYQCSIQGHTHAQGVPVDYNTLHQVIDEVAGINDIMLVSEVDYSESESGTQCALKLVDRNSYTLENNKPVKQKKTAKVGDMFGAEDSDTEGTTE